MKARLSSCIALFALLALGASCEKSGGAKASGSLDEGEKSLLQYIPAGANIVFGGDYAKLMEYWDNSPLKKLSEDVLSQMGPQDQMRGYMTCWVEKERDAKLIGSMSLEGGKVSMNMLFSGLADGVLTECSKKAGFEIHKDDDGKYLEIAGIPDGLGGKTKAGYYFVDSDTVFFSVGVTPGGRPETPGRAELEARIARAKKSPASKDDELKSLLAKADRNKPMWFVGTARGTPVAAQISTGHGYVDADENSITLGFQAELASADLAKTAVAQFDKAKSQVQLLPASFKEAAEAFLDDASLEASGKTLKGKFKLTNEVLNQVLPAMKSAMGAGLR